MEKSISDQVRSIQVHWIRIRSPPYQHSRQVNREALQCSRVDDIDDDDDDDGDYDDDDDNDDDEDEVLVLP